MSAQTFSMGEIAVIAFSHLPDWPVGMEVPILSALTPCFCGCALLGHLIGRDASGRSIWAVPSALRKRPPKQDWKALCHLTDLPRGTETA